MQYGEVPRDWFERVSRMLLQFESMGVSGYDSMPSVSGMIMPVKLTTGWTRETGGMYKANATRLVAGNDAVKYEDNVTDYGEFEVFHPTDGRGESEPSTAQGDLVFVVYRGRWEIIGGGGGGPQLLAKYGVTQQAFINGTAGNVLVYNSNGTSTTSKAFVPSNYYGVLIDSNTPCILLPSEYVIGGITTSWMIVNALYSGNQEMT